MKRKKKKGFLPRHVTPDAGRLNCRERERERKRVDQRFRGRGWQKKEKKR